ncbi:MAG: amidohydrolase family protein [Candidatus Acidiferrum sp.]|jgi:imidazolonepropionase-like amidohydrolase
MTGKLGAAVLFVDRKIILRVLVLAGVLLAGIGLQLAAQSPSGTGHSTLAVTNAKIITVDGPAIERGTLIVHDGKIVAVGDAASTKIPDGATVIDASGKIVMPGIVDSHSHIGDSGNITVSDGPDNNEGTNPIQPALRVIDAINPADPNIRSALSGGITTANILPGSGNVMGGQSAYVKLRGATIEEMLIPGSIGGMKMANGTNPKGYGSRGQAPMTRMEEAALARGIYEKAQQYKLHWDAYNKAVAAGDKTAKAPDLDPGLDAVVQILDGKRIVHNHTHRADDVMTVLRLSDEFHYRVVVHHGTESCLVASELARRHVGVSYTMIDSPGGKPETINVDMSCPARLEKAGVKVAFNTDDPITNSRLLLRSAALAIRGGMSEEAALKGLTIYPAEMLDLQSRLGSLTPGKDADFVVLSGPPFSVYTHVLQTWIEGRKVFDRSDPVDLHYATGGFAVGERYPKLNTVAPPVAGGAQ